MSNTVVEVLVNGKVTLTVPAEIRSDGSIWGRSTSGVTPLINGHLLAEAGITKEEFGRAARDRHFTPQMLACCMKLGENAGGRFVRDKSAAEREEAAERESKLSPLDREKCALRQEIARFVRLASRCDRSQDDEEFRRLRWKAEELQDEFYTRFPEEKRADQAASLRSQAHHVRDLAAGAMLYDCDGWLSYDDQCRRRDEMLAEAAELEAQAAKIEGGAE